MKKNGSKMQANSQIVGKNKKDVAPDVPPVRVDLRDYVFEEEVVELRTKEPGMLLDLVKKKARNEIVSYEDIGTHYKITSKVKLARMFVKPFTMEGITEMEELMTNNYVTERVKIERKGDGVYSITSLHEIYNAQDFMENYWGMLYRKFCAQANVLDGRLWSENDIGMEVAEEDFDKYFYVISLSPVLFEVAARPRFKVQ